MVAVNRESELQNKVVRIGRSWATVQVELVSVVVLLDESNEWAADGSPTCAHWIAERLDVEVCTAREWLRIGRDLKQLVAIRAAFAAGSLSYSKVRALTRVATAENEDELLELARKVPANRLAHALAAHFSRNDPEALERHHEAATGLRRRLEPDGMTTTTTRLPPALEARLTSAVDTHVLRHSAKWAAEAKRTGRWPSLAQQRAYALMDLVTNGGTGILTEVVVHVRGDGCTLDDGTPISDHAVAKLLPDAFVRLLIHDANRWPINASGRRRHPTDRQKRVVHERAQGRCVDCGGTDLIQYDHDPDYETTQRTVVDELVCRCGPCHHKRHADVTRAR
jgi:hypothetical protein